MTIALADPDAFKRWRFGDIRVTRVMEMAPLVIDPSLLLQASAHDVIDRRDWLCPDYASDQGEIAIHYQAFVIEAGGKRVLVDPCVGNAKPRAHPLMSMLDNPFLERLAAAGFPRETIDVVMCTHLHTDHCGWNTIRVDDRWVPTFPNARYLFARTEFEHARAETGGDAPVLYEDSVKPIFDAGLADLVETDHVIVEGVVLEPTPGHTPGHCAVLISSGGSQAMITGDVLHHPLQAALPDVCSHFCWDQGIATATRHDVLDRVARSGAVMIGVHFPGPTGVYVKADGQAWKVEAA